MTAGRVAESVPCLHHSDAGADRPPRRVEETSHVQWPVSAADSGGRDPSGQDQPEAVADGPGERKFLRSGLTRRVAPTLMACQNGNGPDVRSIRAADLNRCGGEAVRDIGNRQPLFLTKSPAGQGGALP